MYKSFKLAIIRNVFLGHFIFFAQYTNTFNSIKSGFHPIGKPKGFRHEFITDFRVIIH